MASWSQFEKEVPEFAAKVQAALEAGRHKTIATLRADGSPRISGIETEFADGELTFGSMPGARKGDDLRRDPRFALHGPTADPPEGDPTGWAGEAKVAGRAVRVGGQTGPSPDGELYRADLDEVVFTGLNAAGTMLVVESWHPGRGLTRVERQ
jgi:hypothetical protein